MDYAELNLRLTTLNDFEKILQKTHILPDSWVARAHKNPDTAAHLDTILPKWLTANISLHRHPRFWPCPPHSHEWFKIIYIYSGKLTIIIDNREITLKKGQTLILPPGIIHASPPAEQSDIVIYLMLKKEYFLKHFFEASFSNSILNHYMLTNTYDALQKMNFIHFASENSRRVKLFFYEMLIEYLEPHFIPDRVLSNLINLLLHELTDLYQHPIPQQSFAKKESTALILEYMETHYKNCSLTEIADHFHFSPNYVSQLLKKATGFTFAALKNEIRLNHASSLLRFSTMSIQEVSRECGYENVSFFYKKFEEKFHKSPSEYRKDEGGRQ